MNVFYYTTPVGKIAIAEKNNAITNIFFETDTIPSDFHVKETALLKETAGQIYLYLYKKLKSFSIPLNPQGTEFYKKVWNALFTIPYGETVTYKTIAQACGNPNAARAVGNACNKNPIPIIIPCHRVLSTSNKLTGYRGGLKLKQKLIALETTKIEVV